jgi:hypothetical protein
MSRANTSNSVRTGILLVSGAAALGVVTILADDKGLAASAAGVMAGAIALLAMSDRRTAGCCCCRRALGHLVFRRDPAPKTNPYQELADP